MGPQRDLYSFKKFLLSYYAAFQAYGFLQRTFDVFSVWFSVYIEVTFLTGLLFLLIS